VATVAQILLQAEVNHYISAFPTHSIYQIPGISLNLVRFAYSEYPSNSF
jgi:hypothetical protein